VLLGTDILAGSIGLGRPLMRSPRPSRPPWRALLALGPILLAAGLALAAPAFDRLASVALQRYGPAGSEKVAAWRQALAEARPLSEADRVARVNSFFNERIHYEGDMAIWGQADYWATPLETLAQGAGDCEDFAIAKYASLTALGVPRQKLRLIYVRAQLDGMVQAHMVLGYYPNPSAEPLVLDSLMNEIRPASRRPDLTPIFSFNGEGLWVGGAAPVSDPTARLSRWRDLLHRMAQEGIE
jgi:predicted transglutaminase-like cysteine proteinase